MRPHEKRNVTALVTDGVLRDRTGVLASALPVWCAGMAAPASVNGLTFVGWNEPIGCGGVAVFPDDIIVVDDDGAVVIPKDLLDFVAHEGAEHELYESWVFTEVERGAQLPGLILPTRTPRCAMRSGAGSSTEAAGVLYRSRSPRFLRAAREPYRYGGIVGLVLGAPGFAGLGGGLRRQR